MSKELEALERLKTAPSFMGGTEKYMFSTQSEIALLEDYEIVKQALIKAQEQEKKNEILKGQVKYLTEVGTEYQKVLEIIMKKDVNFEVFGAFETYEDYEIYYNNKFHLIENKLTQEEFDLLKRYVENE